MTLSVVLPAFNEVSGIREVLARLYRALDGLPVEAEVLVVDDGSTDGTWEALLEESGARPELRAIRLSRNFGHQVALTAGLMAARGDFVITMDSDLQHPPEMIPSLVEQAEKGYDVVYAVRGPGDSEGRLKIATARAFYWLLDRMTALELPHGGADFRIMSRRAVDALLSMPERHRFLRGMTRWIGFEQTFIEYARGDRAGGSSKYTWRRMVRLAIDGIVSFSAFPLRVASAVGALVALAGAVYLVYVLGVRIFTDDAVPGWTSVVIVSLLLGGVQLMFIGLIGQYLSRMYDEDKARPLFFIAADTDAGGPDRIESVSAWPGRDRL